MSYLIPSGDTTGVADTTAIQASLAAKGYAELDTGSFYTTGLNLTASQGLSLIGWGTRTYLLPSVGGGNVIDLTGASNPHLEGLHLMPNASLTTNPKIGILTAQIEGQYGSDSIFMDRVRVEGTYDNAAFYCGAVASSCLTRCQFYNTKAMAALFTGNNYFGAVSAFVPIDTGTSHVPSDWTFLGCEIHQLSASFGLFLGAVQSLRWYGGNIASSLYPVSLSGVAQSQPQDPNYIVFDGTTFYNDQAPTPACAVQGQAGLPAVTFRDCQSSFPLTGC